MEQLFYGLTVAAQPINLFYAFVGVFLGNLMGVLPGIGALAALSMLLPVTYGIPPVSAIIMLAGLYVGTGFGGAITSILMNIPGAPAHAVVCLDGHPLALRGRSGPAIFMAMASSFTGVVIAVLIMAVLSVAIAKFAVRFGPWEYFALMIMGLLAASAVGGKSVVNAIGAMLIGLVLGVVGMDINVGIMRFTFGSLELADGISLVALALGLFGISDVFANGGKVSGTLTSGRQKLNMAALLPTRDDIKRSIKPILRGAGIGSFLGALPGTGGTLAAFVSYGVEKGFSKNPQEFGMGAIEGVSGPEAANSSAEITAFIPTLTLGIPGDAVMAVMLGALMVHNITPGPSLILEHSELFWGLIGSFIIGNCILLFLNIPLINIWVRLLTIPFRYVFPVILALMLIATYSEGNSLFDVAVVCAVGFMAYIGHWLEIPVAPMLLAFILGPMLEENFVRAMSMSDGDWTSFFTRPLSGSFMFATILILALVTFKKRRSRV